MQHAGQLADFLFKYLEARRSGGIKKEESMISHATDGSILIQLQRRSRLNPPLLVVQPGAAGSIVKLVDSNFCVVEF